MVADNNRKLVSHRLQDHHAIGVDSGWVNQRISLGIESIHISNRTKKMDVGLQVSGNLYGALTSIACNGKMDIGLVDLV